MFVEEVIGGCLVFMDIVRNGPKRLSPALIPGSWHFDLKALVLSLWSRYTHLIPYSPKVGPKRRHSEGTDPIIVSMGYSD